VPGAQTNKEPDGGGEKTEEKVTCPRTIGKLTNLVLSTASPQKKDHGKKGLSGDSQ